jgi:hypothetical protein
MPARGVAGRADGNRWIEATTHRLRFPLRLTSAKFDIYQTLTF